VLESILIEVGSAVAEHVFAVKIRERWRARTIQAHLQGRGYSLLDSRKAKRQFDQVAEAFAESLGGLLEVESPDMPDNERESTLAAVRDTFEMADIDYEALLAVDLDPAELEKWIRGATISLQPKFALSEQGAALYDRILGECCNYVAEVALKIPDLQGKALREILRRESDLAKQVQVVLARMPVAKGTADTSDSAFELQYRRQLARKLDELQLFGLTSSDTYQRYPLTIAYISLALNTFGMSTEEGLNEHGESNPEDADKVLQQHHRLIIRGEAGSGKTTLLQWIAVTCARADGSGDDNGSGDIPFFLQLRRYVGRPLPKPSEFLDLITPTLADKMPAGWVSRQLESGRGLILIDGLDEFPASDRQEVAEWMNDLGAVYSNCRYVLTSRPSGLSDNWIDSINFAGAELLPMTPSNVGSFIKHWHDAARDTVSGDDDRTEIDLFEKNLKRLVASSPPIRKLATSPLLCAMLCALHRDRRTQVPADRSELYRIALETLIDRRDVERRVATSKFSLTLPQKLNLLQAIAHWLMLNDLSDASREDVIGQLELRLQSMRKVSAAAATVYDYLLERSGLLREPVVGRVDFLHRTFQEYLAALEVVSLNNINMLVEKATNDQWREVIILACGRAAPDQQEKLIVGLLAKGKEEPQSKHVLHLLAVACLETSVTLSRELEKIITQALKDLVPPTSMTEAKYLASAGDLAIPTLIGHGANDVQAAAACVRALSLIGGEAALHAVAWYGRDARRTVFRELLRAWTQFDAKQYAEVVMAHSPHLRGGIDTQDLELANAARHLPRPTAIKFRLFDNQYGLTALREHPYIHELELGHNTLITDLSILTTLPSLAVLDIASCTGIEDFTPLRSCRKLRRLNVSATKIGPDFSVLPIEQSLFSLHSYMTDAVVSMEGIQRQSDLAIFSFSRAKDAPAIRDWTLLRQIESLRTVAIHDRSFPGLVVLENSVNLTELRLSTDSAVGGELATFPNLQSLTLTSGTSLTAAGFDALAQNENLRQVVIQTPNGSDLQDFAPGLTGLSVSGLGLRTLSGAPEGLRKLAVADSRFLEDISALGNLGSLRFLSLTNLSEDLDLGPLSLLPRWAHVYLDDAAEPRLPEGLRCRVSLVRPSASAHVREAHFRIR
jgi:Leucine-rich repeat (LRR) protein